MTTSIVDVLAECLDAIDRGEMTPVECVERYPEYRDELRDLLSVVTSIQALPPISPRIGFRQVARTRLLNQLAPWEQPVTLTGWLQALWQGMPRLYFRFERMSVVTRALAIVALVLVAVGLSTGGAAYAASDALPGDQLYPLKIAVEDARLIIADDEGDALLHIKFALNRVQEIESLTAESRHLDVEAAVQGFERHVVSTNRTLMKVSAHDAQYAGNLAALFDQVLGRTIRILSDLLPVVPKDHQVPITLAIAVAGDQRSLLAGSFPGDVKVPGNQPGKAEPVVPSVSTVTEEPVISDTDTPIPTPLQAASSTAIFEPTSKSFPTSIPTPSVIGTRTPTPSVTSTLTPTRTATRTHTPAPPSNTSVPPTDTPEPPPTKTKAVPPGLTKTPQPPGQTKTPKP